MSIPSHSSQRRAFTLVELLSVLAIIAVISAFTVPMIMSLFSTYQLDSAGQVIVNQLNFARQTALSRGRAVQVRFYLLPDYNAASTSAPAVYRGMQSFVELDPTGSSSTESLTTSAIVKPIFFSAPIVISQGTVSPLLPTTTNLSNSANHAADPANPLPVYQSNYQYVMFHFKADGSTDLTPSLNSLSLVIEKEKTGTSGLPANFQTVTIDPLGGTIKSFRP